MPTSRRHALPLGAKGIDLHEAVLMFARNKIVLARKGANEHYTIHFGPYSGELDIHRTTHTSGRAVHQRLYAIAHDRLASLLEELAPQMFQALMRCVHPLDLRTLAEKEIGVVVGLLVTTDEIETMADVRDGRLVLSPDKVAARAWIPDSLDDLHQLRDGEFFTLFAGKRHAPRVVGHGFALIDAAGQHQLLRLSSRRVEAEMDRMVGLLLDTAAKYGKNCDACSTGPRS